jgi:hypothetical protein
MVLLCRVDSRRIDTINVNRKTEYTVSICEICLAGTSHDTVKYVFQHFHHFSICMILAMKCKYNNNVN